MRIEEIRPETLLRNTGDPQAAISLINATRKCGLVKHSNVFLRQNGTIAATEESHIAVQVATAEPTTSIFSTNKNSTNSAMVSRLQAILMNILVFTYPLIRK